MQTGLFGCCKWTLGVSDWCVSCDTSVPVPQVTNEQVEKMGGHLVLLDTSHESFI